LFRGRRVDERNGDGSITQVAGGSLFLGHAFSCLPRAANRCISRRIRRPSGARLTLDGALLLCWGVGLLVRHEHDRQDVLPDVWQPG
jgi:hypothetical protein